jgi:hypothetical protein
MPKTRGMLSAWEARPGCKLAEIDFEAVEPTVLAEFSRDASYMMLYGPGAPANDVYTFVGSKLRTFQAKLAGIYDPAAPTKEALAHVKSHFKKDRAVWKKLHLSATYLAGPRKIYEDLKLEGVDISLEEVQQMHHDYWHDVFPGVKQYITKLEREWQKRGGWILNGIGRPLAVAEDKKKDLLNRFCQSTGHDLLQRMLLFVTREVEKRKLPAEPWLVDLHDETFWEVEEAHAEEMAEVYKVALAQLNQSLGWSVTIKGKPEIVDNFAQVKIEE